MLKEKKCSGLGRAKGHGCKTLVPVEMYGKPNRVLGLGKSCGCYSTWLTTTDEGKLVLEKATLSGKRTVRIQTNKVKKAEKKKFRDQKRELNTAGAMKLADTYFSRFIRLKHSLHEYCTCYTCGTDKPIKEVDNGHYLKREHKATRYHEDNCRPQCKTCNGDIKHNGKQAEFRVGLTYEIGEDRVVEMESLARTIISANSTFYRGIADTYREKVNKLQREMKVKYW